MTSSRLYPDKEIFEVLVMSPRILVRNQKCVLIADFFTVTKNWNRNLEFTTKCIYMQTFYVLCFYLTLNCEKVKKDEETFLINWIHGIIGTFGLVQSAPVSCWHLSIFNEKHTTNQCVESFIQAVIV